MDKFYVSPSTDPAKGLEDIIKYADEIKDSADFLHCDVMDGKFVERSTFDYNAIKLIKERTALPLDVHLMVKEPSKVIQKYIDAGSNVITVHYEAYQDKKKLEKDLKKISKSGCLCGISIKPKTDIHEIMHILSLVDIVLLMSVEPGKSGQVFINETYSKLIELDKLREDYSSKFKIEVDGGIKPEISHKLKRFGADIVVSGNFVYQSPDRLHAIKQLR